MREIVFDTETTGLNPADDRLVEIGCIELVGRVETGNHYHAYFHPECDMPAGAERIHGLTTAFLSAKPRFAECVAEMLAFIGDAPLIAHNAEFDFGFLNAELARCGLPPLLTTRMVDTLAMAKKRHPGAKHTLDALCVRYGIDRSHRVRHGALLDAQLLAQLYIELTGGRQIGLGLADASLDALVAAEAAPVDIVPPRPVRAPRPHAASLAEIERHRAFVATLVSPVWERFAPG